MTRTTSRFVLGVTAVAGTLALLTLGASAQTTTTAPAPKATTTAPAPKATTTAPAVKAPAAPKAATTPAKTPIVCKGRDEASCKTEATACQWIVPKKVEANGKVDPPYCRRVAGVAKKAADKKAATSPATATAPATTAPAAPAKSTAPAPTTKK